MRKYDGITTKILKNGSKNIYVRLKYNGTNYGVKNLTKQFGVRTEKEGFQKVNEIKVLLSKGHNPFNQNSLILDKIWEKKLLTTPWSKNTKKNYIIYYDIVIRDSIGNKPINKITVDDIKKIKNTMSEMSISYQNRIKMILNPIFQDSVINGDIQNNIFMFIKNKVPKSAQPINLKIIEEELVIARKIYKVLNEKKFDYKSNNRYRQKDDELDETNNFFMLLLLTSHRYGELLQLKKENIYEDKIVSPSYITKTKVQYEFPLPNELITYINSIKDGLLFPNLNKGKIDNRFQKLINMLDITKIENQTITPHDLRRIFMSILVRNGINDSLADYCLEHKISGVKSHYLHYNYSDKKITYNKYWDLIKN